MARSAVASLSWLLETHRNARIGSPIVAGSSNRSKSASSVGSFVANRGLPPPLRRTFRPSEPGSRKSFRPRPIVLRASFVTREAAAIPPYPAGLARQARNEQLHTGCGGVIRRSSTEYRRWPCRQESCKQPQSVKAKTRFNCFWASPNHRRATWVCERRTRRRGVADSSRSPLPRRSHGVGSSLAHVGRNATRNHEAGREMARGRRRFAG